MATIITIPALCLALLRGVTTGHVRRIPRQHTTCTSILVALIRRTTTVVPTATPYAALLGRKEAILILLSTNIFIILQIMEDCKNVRFVTNSFV